MQATDIVVVVLVSMKRDKKNQMFLISIGDNPTWYEHNWEFLSPIVLNTDY